MLEISDALIAPCCAARDISAPPAAGLARVPILTAMSTIVATRAPAMSPAMRGPQRVGEWLFTRPMLSRARDRGRLRQETGMTSANLT